MSTAPAFPPDPPSLSTIERGALLQSFVAALSALIAADLRVRLAARRVENDVTPAAFAEVDSAAQAKGAARDRAFDAWIRIGRAAGFIRDMDDLRGGA